MKRMNRVTCHDQPGLKLVSLVQYQSLLMCPIPIPQSFTVSHSNTTDSLYCASFQYCRFLQYPIPIPHFTMSRFNFITTLWSLTATLGGKYIPIILELEYSVFSGCCDWRGAMWYAKRVLLWLYKGWLPPLSSTLSSTPLLLHQQTVSSDARRGSDGYNLDTLTELQREALFIPRSNLDSFQQIGEGNHFEPVPCILAPTEIWSAFYPACASI